MFLLRKTLPECYDEFKMKLKDLEFKETIGKGAFGRVKLCNIKDNEKMYACKIIKKKKVLQAILRLKEEVNALQNINSPFVTKIHHVFQDEFKLYLIQEYVARDFLELLSYKKILTENEARFYFVEIYLALSDIHKKNIVYRDLKPENILIDNDGHIKLCDFGLCKKLKKTEKTYSVCGTIEYESPEVILGQGHDLSTDYWSLGVLLYELVVGSTPFFHINQKKLSEKILVGTLEFPNRLSREVVDLIKSLIEKDVEARKKNYSKIIKHAWLSDVNWNDAKSKKVKPPCKLGEEKIKRSFKDSSDTIESPLGYNEKKLFEEFAKLCCVK